MTDLLARYLVPVEGPVAFIRDQIVLPDGRRVGDVDGDPWIERRVLRPVFEQDDGLPSHRLVYLELPRGHWKSGAGAAIAVTEAMLNASTEVIVCAADRDQAAIVGDHIAGYLHRNPLLGASFATRGDAFIVGAQGSRIRIIPSDAPTSWGLGGTHRRFRVVADELTVWKTRDLWDSVISATGKVPDVQTIVLSNAGFDPDHAWQWGVRETAEREPWGYLFSAPGVIASWIEPAWVEQMRSCCPARRSTGSSRTAGPRPRGTS
jgi:hypothetical protein